MPILKNVNISYFIKNSNLFHIKQDSFRTVRFLAVLQTPWHPLLLSKFPSQCGSNKKRFNYTSTPLLGVPEICHRYLIWWIFSIEYIFLQSTQLFLLEWRSRVDFIYPPTSYTLHDIFTRQKATQKYNVECKMLLCPTFSLYKIDSWTTSS